MDKNGTTWTNYDNQEFYETLSLEDFKKFAACAGLTAYSDLRAIDEYIKPSKSILEIGAGFGRVIDYLLKNYPAKSVVGIESCQKLFDFLTRKYKANSQVRILKQDIHSLKIDLKQDLILWMWSGVADFSPLEQTIILKNLKAILSDQGVLIVDTISPNRTPVGMEKQEPQVFLLNYHGSTIHTYSLTNEEIDTYAQELLLKVKHLDYITTTGRIRSLHIFTKILV